MVAANKLDDGVAPFGAAVKAKLAVGRTANKNAAKESFIVVCAKVSDSCDTQDRRLRKLQVFNKKLR